MNEHHTGFQRRLHSMVHPDCPYEQALFFLGGWYQDHSSWGGGGRKGYGGTIVVQSGKGGPSARPLLVVKENSVVCLEASM